MPVKSPHGIGNRKLAAQVGVSSHLVSRKRRQGKSDEVIAAEAKVQRERQSQRPRAKAKFRPKSSKPAAHIAVSSPVSADMLDAIAAVDPTESFFDAQRRKESALANLREIDVRKNSDELVEVEAVRLEWSKHISAVKNSLLLLPSKLAPKLAVAGETLKCQHILDTALRSTLTELSDYETNAA